MGRNLYVFAPAFLFVLGLLQVSRATRYIVTDNVPNTPGGKVFENEIGVNFTLLTMNVVNKFIWKIFEQRTPAEAKQVPVLNVYISDFQGYGYTNGDNINISGPALNQFYSPRNKSKFYFTSLMYHEMTHIFQWSGNRTAPGGLTEGIADYVMVKSNIYEKDKYPNPGAGKKWDEGYGVTERFLEYCDSLRKGFTATLNKKMRYSYSDHYFVELLGKPLDQLWREYKAKYGNIPGAATDGTFPGMKY